MRVHSCGGNAIHEEAVKAAREAMLPPDVFSIVSSFFKVLGDETRIRILWALDVRELCVCDLAGVLGMTKSAVSHQLRVLKQARLVKYRKEGKMVYYSLDDEHVKKIFDQGLAHISH